MLGERMKDEVTLVRDGREISTRAYVEGAKVYAPLDIDAKEGDILILRAFRSRLSKRL